MAKLFIVHPSGVKTEVSREQLVNMARSGQIMADTQIEAKGQVIPAGKIKGLHEIFAERDPKAASPTTPPPPFASEPARAPEANAPSPAVQPRVETVNNNHAPSGAAHNGDAFARPPERRVEVPNAAAVQAKVRGFVTRFVKEDANDSVAQRARARTKSMTAPFSLCKTLCLIQEAMAALSSVIYFIYNSCLAIINPTLTFKEKLGEILAQFFICLGMFLAASLVYYLLWGVFNYIVQYARQRAEDSVRREDFYEKTLQILVELDERTR